MRIIICDDNELFLQSLYERLNNYCARFDYTLSCELCLSPEKLWTLDLSTVEIMFLDVDMPTMNGIETARRLRMDYPDLLIIFVTNWIQYAPSGYQVSAFRYLLKDSLSDEFESCMNDVMSYLSQRNATALFSYRNGEQSNIPLSHILYLEGTPYRRIYLHTTGCVGTSIECVGKLKDYIDSLKDNFLLIQRSYLVNMQHIRQMRNYEVFLSNGEVLKASRRNFVSLKSEYALWKVNRL